MSVLRFGALIIFLASRSSPRRPGSRAPTGSRPRPRRSPTATTGPRRRRSLRIASGDIVDVDTLLTNTPPGLQRAGVPPERIQASLKAIVAEVTGDRRGPGGHILTGPVYVEGAEPGDVLEVKILSIDLPHRLRLQRLQRLHPRELRPLAAGADP